MSDAKDYITKREIPQLFECLMTGLMYHRPGDHVAYLQECLANIKSRGVSSVRWDLFLEAKRSKTPLAPVTPPRSAGRASSRASSRAESLFDKKPVLPPIGHAGDAAATAVPKLAQPVSCPVLLVIGGPGSGRARVARVVAERYSFRLVSVGQLLKSEPDAAAAVAAGELAPDAVVLSALIGALNDQETACDGLVIEGYPRSLSQLEDYLEHIQRVDHALLLDYEESSLQERLLRDRRGAGDDADRPAGIARRLNAFKAACLPACRALDDDGKLLVLPVDPEAADESVATEAARLLDAILTPHHGGEAGALHRPQSAPASPPPPAAAAGAPLLTIRELTSFDPAVERVSGAPALVLLMGGPGSGRTTCLERLARISDGRVHRIDAADCGDDADAVAERMERAAADCGSSGALVLEGFPETEAGLRALYTRVGAPDLVVLIDCHETDMLTRGAAPGKVARFKEETLPVVQHLDRAGRLCVVLGNREPDEVLKEVKALVDFVALGEVAAPIPDQQRPVAEAAAEALAARHAGTAAAPATENGAAEATDEEAAAAAKIQAGFRGYQTRKQLAQRK